MKRTHLNLRTVAAQNIGNCRDARDSHARGREETPQAQHISRWQGALVQHVSLRMPFLGELSRLSKQGTTPACTTTCTYADAQMYQSHNKGTGEGTTHLCLRIVAGDNVANGAQRRRLHGW